MTWEDFAFVLFGLGMGAILNLPITIADLYFDVSIWCVQLYIFIIAIFITFWLRNVDGA